MPHHLSVIPLSAPLFNSLRSLSRVLHFVTCFTHSIPKLTRTRRIGNAPAQLLGPPPALSSRSTVDTALMCYQHLSGGAIRGSNFPTRGLHRHNLSLGRKCPWTKITGVPSPRLQWSSAPWPIVTSQRCGPLHAARHPLRLSQRVDTHVPVLSELEKVEQITDGGAVGWGVQADRRIVSWVEQIVATAARYGRQTPVALDEL